MKVFVTGATGFIGSAIVQELIGAGHQVLGLARTDAAAKLLIAAGAEVHRGDLEDVESMKKGAAASDGVIHTAFNHDFSRFKTSTEEDRQIIEAFGSVLAGSKRPLVITSAIGLLPQGKLATENDAAVSGPNPRIASEEAAAVVAAAGVHVSVVRLAPSVHDDGDHGFIPMLARIAREKGVSVYKGDGQNRWPALHRLDAARLYRLAVEKTPAGLTRFHGIAEEGIAFRDIAEVIGKRLHIPVVSKSAEEAAEHFGWFAHFASMDIIASSKQTQEQLGWHPAQPGLIADIDRDSYFSI
jgi:nucleoside-diphosphate-sugar epimerase